MFSRSISGCFCLVALVAAGCSKETTSSSNIKTGGIAALIDVYADTNDTATVHVKLVVGGEDSNTYVDLESPDELTATAARTTKTLSAIDPGIYEAKFTGVTGGSVFSVSLDRPSDVTASDNSGTLPEPFAVEAPASNLSRAADDLAIAWSPANTGDGMTLDFDGDCIFPYSKAVSDTGSYVVAKGTLDSTGGNMPETCDLTLAIARSRNGSADAKFDPESHFRLHQRRKASFTSNP